MSPAELLQAQADELADRAAAVEDTVMQRAEMTLRAYRRACQIAGATRRGRGGRGAVMGQWPRRLNAQGSDSLAAYAADHCWVAKVSNRSAALINAHRY